MDDLERQLKDALVRKDPPAWFEAKVMAAVAREPRPAREWWQRWFGGPSLKWATAGLATLTVVTGIAWQRERLEEERIAGEAAKAQLELALRITGEKLQFIEQKIQQNN